ncbi:MAG TPA: hypothetical protein VF771_06545 [Longimicrobiaceae bacterium]
MAFTLGAPEPWASGGWKIKILDREWGEEPHFNFMRGRGMWRFGLRRISFMDRAPDPREVPEELVEFAMENLALLIQHWDAAHPRNPVATNGCDDE